MGGTKDYHACEKIQAKKPKFLLFFKTKSIYSIFNE